MNNTDKAREYLIENLLPKFSDSTFQDYVKNELAGDFAYQLAMYLKSQAQTQQTEIQAKKFCSNCASFRSGDKCHKCGEDTFTPDKRFTEQKLPPIDIIKTIAREAGYAVAVHGTQERDLDVIAAPWTEDAVGNHELMERIANGINAVILETERKPFGRYAATIQIDGWYKPLDLSVCPRLEIQQESIGEVQHYAAPANLPAYVNVKWYGKPPKNGTKVYVLI